MRVRACVWDLDGTLLYTLPTVHYYCNRSLKHFGLHEITIAETMALCRMSIQHFYHELLRLGGCPEQDIARLQPQIHEYDCAAYLKDAAFLTYPYDGIVHTLDALSARGIQHAVLTNKPSALAVSLIHHFFENRIPICIGQTLDSISKPHPHCMNGIFKALSCAKEEILYIGDTDVDMETACNTGVAAAAALWGYQPDQVLLSYKPQFALHTAEALLTLI